MPFCRAEKGLCTQRLSIVLALVSFFFGGGGGLAEILPTEHILF